ncbi:MAG: VOC family protein [Gammaproteobacteria bacterium]|nr:VOC family protein [Gammaproteobacteria bacterium]
MATVKLKNELTLALSVKNRAQSADWYTKHLGFEVSMAIDEAGWTEMTTHMPGVILGLGDTDEVNPGNCVPVFGVDNVASAREALESESIQFDGDTMTIEGMVSLATFYDPDGNAIMLAEDLTG